MTDIEAADTRDGRLSMSPVPFDLESEFEIIVVQWLAAAYPDYSVTTFGGLFVIDGERRKPDLALFAKDLSHWFLIEVEIATHGLRTHVVPQLRVLKYGAPEASCVTAMAQALGLDRERCEFFLRTVPPTVVVVTNEYSTTWRDQLEGLGVQFVVLRYFRPDKGGFAACVVEGEMIPTESVVAHGIFYAAHRAVRFSAVFPMPDGPVKISAPASLRNVWTVRRSGATAWMSAPLGIVNVPDGSTVSLVRTLRGDFAFRVKHLERDL